VATPGEGPDEKIEDTHFWLVAHVGRVERVEDHLDRGGTLIRAAGGVLIRPGGSGVEVLVVHRPKYDDWTFPKGKADRGESDEKCALREVEEETGLRC
jgi:8-oxo-dGTP pyrophosphatase MutT (NUDIX family)